MSQMTLQDRARSLAYIAHFGQPNQHSGEDYINHPMRVAAYISRAVRLLEAHSWKDVCNDSETHPLGEYGGWAHVQEICRAIAWLHDTIEDTWVDEVILDRVFFDAPEVTPAVVALSRKGHGTNPHLGRDYYLVVAESPLTLVVKLADIMDNGDPHRLAKIEDDSDRTRLEHKYDWAADRMGVWEEYKTWQTSRRDQMTLGGPLKMS